MEKMKIKTDWDFKHLFKGDKDPEIKKERAKIERAISLFEKNWKGKETRLLSPISMKRALDEYEQVMCVFGGGGKEAYYFWLRRDLDESNPELKASMNRADDFLKKQANRIAFFEITLGKIEKKNQKKLLNSKLLSPYRHFLELAFANGAHLLSEAEEKLMTLKDASARENWTRMTEEFLSREERIVRDEAGKLKKKNFSEILALMNSPRKQTRTSANAEFNNILKRYADIAEWELNSILQDKKTNDELRGFIRPDASRHLADDIDTDSIDALVKVVESHFSISRRFYALKAKLLGLKKLQYYERNVPFLAGKEERVPFSRAVDITSTVFGRLNPEFLEIFKKFLREGLIDAFPKKGKAGGAYCAHNTLSSPTYILLNYMERLRDVTTLAHEVGHGINNELMRKSRHALDYSSPTSTAEVASTFMENFVFDELSGEASETTRLALLIERLNDEVSTVFRQIACYKFEQELHSEFRKRGHLPKKIIGEIFQKNMSAYMGKAVLQSAGSENWWIYWGHIRNYFYVYSYASGLLISKSLQGMVKKDPKDIKKVKKFLSAGRSDSPKNIFSHLGIDISKPLFWNIGVREIEATLKEAERLAKKLGKI